jgi:hypothetical protein
MINYNLEIVSLEVYPHTGSYDNVVYNVFSRLWAQSGSYTDIAPLSTVVEFPQSDFIPYEDLTNEIVTGWVNNAVDMPALELQLSASLAIKALPPTSEVLPVPWQ